ncbi:hypothetical protein [Streptomyces carpinensis]|uniref:Uncharacterized protein n=1 Tax=Streptomyces carpinensis TaxID=66369 RepID=A0ABV1VYP5_9ACTN|nr:hypothetical protein [Streptomyces carpinensis]
MHTFTAVADRTWDRAPAYDSPLPPPNPADRIACLLDPRDLRRLDLYAALTAAGIAPFPGDREAIVELSTLSDRVHEALHRWLSSGR